MAFSHNPLSEEGDEIRLLVIEPSNQEDGPIHTRLEHVSIEDEPAYFALSYTWGRPARWLDDSWDNPQSTKPIVVNGRCFRVRYNLFSALVAIRKNWPSEAFWWIDAICIDQTNILERNTQVARMRDIYGCSMGCLSWLGPSDIVPLGLLLRLPPSRFHGTNDQTISVDLVLMYTSTWKNTLVYYAASLRMLIQRTRGYT